MYTKANIIKSSWYPTPHFRNYPSKYNSTILQHNLTEHSKNLYIMNLRVPDRWGAVELTRSHGVQGNHYSGLRASHFRLKLLILQLSLETDRSPGCLRRVMQPDLGRHCRQSPGRPLWTEKHWFPARSADSRQPSAARHPFEVCREHCW